MAADPGAAVEHGEPYQGLRPYQEQDKDKFFGRDADCQILIDKILANKLTLLFAASGVGKSSLLQAAVLPRLKDPRQENLDAVYYFDWISPPLGGLKQAVLDYLKDQNRLEADIPLQDLEQSTLKEFFDFCTLFTRHPLVIILDQFEEFFRYQRYTADFKLFIQQLATVVTDKGTAVAVVISMREDFALELNAFKPQLPTLLFENFYRLERLTKENARIAIETPVKRLGFHYEEPLLTELLNDLAVREVSQYSANPIGEFIDAVEPAYLQIICSQLWELDRRDRDKALRYETYQSKGRAKGLVQNYVSDVLNRCSTNEKKLASLAFDHLITRRGAKMAFTVDDLAHLIGTDPQKLGQVLEKLEKNRILRGQSRQGVQWYELYHDLFSEPIERWNDAFKAAERNRRAVNRTILTILAGLALYVVIDIAVNYTSHQLRLSVKRGISDAIELYRGKPGSLDILGLQQYITETGYHRAQIEPDKLFTEKSVADFKTLTTDLIGHLPLVERIEEYWESGEIHKALSLAENSISEDDLQRSEAVIGTLARFRSTKTTDRLKQQFTNTTNVHLREKITDGLGYIYVPQTVPALHLAATDGNPEVRRSAARALGQLGRPEAVTPLIAWLKDPDEYVRNSVAQALGQLDKTQVVMPLIEQLKIQSGTALRSILLTLGRLSDLRARDAVLVIYNNHTEPDSRVKRTAAAALLAFHRQDGLGLLTRLAQSTNINDRKEAAELLGIAADEPATQLLISLLDDENIAVKLNAIASLGQIKATAALPKLHGLLQDKNINLQRAAADTLAQMASPESIPVLQKVLFDTQASIPVRLTALKASGNIGTDEAIAVILDALKRQDDLLESKAYQVLGERKASQALALLSERLTQVEQQYREWRRIRDTGREDFTEQETEAWAKRLAEAQPTPYRGFTLAYAIAQIDPQASGITLLSHDLAEVRQGAWMGLGKAGDVALLRLLYPKWRDTDDPIFRVAAYRAIDTILIYLESYGDAKVFQELKAFYNQVKDQEAVATRVEWTLVQLEQRQHEPAKTPASTH